jgi:demethylmenaquinone methyltransferase/2-methoxy-6-polyprenyl-1,4-benzoquinol methylase
VSAGVGDSDDDRLLDGQLRYYGDRAPTYDDAYTRTGHSDRGAEANARWFAELAVVEAAVDELDLRGDVLELGCGTGHWTARLAAQARSVTALDASPEMLEVARRKLAAAENVALERVDLVRDWEPSRTWDAVVAFFFLEHVPDAHFDSLVARIARALAPSGVVLIAEGRHRGEEHVADVERRHLHDHAATYDVVERRRTADEFVAAFAGHGLEVSTEHTERNFTIVTARRR